MGNEFRATATGGAHDQDLWVANPMTLIPRRPKPGQSLQYGATTLNQAVAKAVLHRGQLPPGELRDLDVLEPSNRAVLIHETAQHGPIFKVTAYGKFWVCLVGLDLARRFMKSLGDGIRPVTMDIQSLVFGGFMRQMTGGFHRTYRGQLGSGLAKLDLDALAGALEPIVETHLRSYYKLQSTQGLEPHDYEASVHNLVTDILLHLLFGANPGTEFHQALVDGYNKLGGDGLAWTPGNPQTLAFGKISELLRRQCAELGSTSDGTSGGVMGHIARESGLDDTMLGNLIYMAEMGRDDVTVLFRWLTKYGSEMPEFLDRIADEDANKLVLAGDMTRAFVSEALRTDQSYRLLRITTRNVEFDGFFIPKNSMIRVCMWESHRSAEVFDRPFEFDPTRFLDNEYNAVEFSPFGIDQHQCPFASLSYLLSEVFLTVMARNYRVRALQDGGPHRGPYHWEPSSRLLVGLESRT